jgi:hypothetical protein
MSDPYRDVLPATKDEVQALELRVAMLEKRKPRSPFELKLFHTLTAGVIGVIGTIFAFGYVYDHMHDSGIRLSTYLTIGLFSLISGSAIIASLVGLDCRNNLGSPWKLQ